MSEEKKLDESLDRWECHYEPESDLMAKIGQRIARTEADHLNQANRVAEGFGGWLRVLHSRPLYALGYAAAFALIGFVASAVYQMRDDTESPELTLSYRLSIDPLYRLEAFSNGSDLGGTRDVRHELSSNRIDWLQGELDLSNAQYQQVSKLHDVYGAAFDKVFLGLVQSQVQYRELDQKRMSDDVIDYFLLYDLINKQKRLSHESNQLTQELLEKVSEVFTPEQRRRYRKLLENEYPHSAEKPNDATNA